MTKYSNMLETAELQLQLHHEEPADPGDVNYTLHLPENNFLVCKRCHRNLGSGGKFSDSVSFDTGSFEDLNFLLVRHEGAYIVTQDLPHAVYSKGDHVNASRTLSHIACPDCHTWLGYKVMSGSGYAINWYVGKCFLFARALLLCKVVHPHMQHRLAHMEVEGIEYVDETNIYKCSRCDTYVARSHSRFQHPNLQFSKSALFYQTSGRNVRLDAPSFNTYGARLLSIAPLYCNGCNERLGCRILCVDQPSPLLVESTSLLNLSKLKYLDDTV